MLGNLLNISGFAYDSSEGVRDEVLGNSDVSSRLNNNLQGFSLHIEPASTSGLQRIAEVPIYAADAIVRRAVALQKTRDAAVPQVSMHSEELAKLGAQPGDQVKVSQGQGSVSLTATADDKLPRGAARVAAGHPATMELGAMFGTIKVERA